MTENGYRFVKLSKENVKDLVPIYSNAFGKEVSIDFLNKKQDTSFAGPNYAGYIAYTEEGQPVAFYGVFPCFIEYNGKRYLAAQSGDTMTHSLHTGKGLFTALAKETYEYCRSAGIHFVFGFPNENSYPGFVKKLDWIHVNDLIAYIIRVRTAPWVRIKKTFHLPSSLHTNWCRFILCFYKKGEPFKNSVLDENIAGINRDAAFFIYKKYEDSFLLNIKGVQVWLKLSEDFLYIGDIERCSDAKFEEVIRQLKKMAFVMGLHHLRYHCTPNAFHRKKFSEMARVLDLKYPVAGISFSNEVPLDHLAFTMADNDGF